MSADRNGDRLQLTDGQQPDTGVFSSWHIHGVRKRLGEGPKKRQSHCHVPLRTPAIARAAPECHQDRCHLAELLSHSLAGGPETRRQLQLFPLYHLRCAD